MDYGLYSETQRLRVWLYGCGHEVHETHEIHEAQETHEVQEIVRKGLVYYSPGFSENERSPLFQRAALERRVF